MFVVDTNILIYAANGLSPEHKTCRDLLVRWRTGTSPWFLTWNVVYEFLRVMTHRGVMERPWTAGQAWDFVAAMLESPGLSVMVEGTRHREVATELAEKVSGLCGNLVHDAHTVALMLEHGIHRIYTRDSDFHRFPGIQVIDPLIG